MDIDKELDDLWNDPLLGITEQEASLFDIPADMRLAMKRKKADHIAQYTPCPNFDLYQPLFEQVHQELKTGQRSIVKVHKTENLIPGHFYIVDGVMLYLDAIGEKYKDSGNSLPNGRTHCVLENGTETDILLQTLRKNVVSNGYGISDTTAESEKVFSQLSGMTDDDQVTGYIYVLSSLSKNEEIAAITNLYKIGFTVNSVEERIKNAAHEPTYLMAPVKIEASYKIVNLNSHIFETLIHQVLDAVQMNLTVWDPEGEVHHPKEWFVVPIEVIDTIIRKILDGTIMQYTYNTELQCLEKVIQDTHSTLNTQGLKVLNLIIKKKYLDEILSGEKTIEYRELKQTVLNKYTYIDEADGKRYLRWYDLLHLFVGYNKNRENIMVEVKDITYHEGVVEYHLGQVLEHKQA